MKAITVFFLLIFFNSWGQNTTTILSPKENIVLLPYDDMISQPALPDTIEKLNSILEVNNLWVIGSENGIYLLDNKTEKLLTYFKFDIKSHKELFDGQDSLVSFSYTNFIMNKTNEKALVVASNGIVFQIDLGNRTIDWLVKFIDRIETATYSDDGNTIAIGTRYNYKSKSGRIITEYYSTLFLINSNTGAFIDYFQEYASIKKILFIHNDTKLLVAYDWNCTDTYLWEIANRQKKLAQFDEVDAYLYDIVFLGDNKFATINGAGVSKWDLNKPKQKKKLVYDESNVGTARIIENRYSGGYIYNESGPYLAQSGKLIFFDHNIQLVDSLTVATSFDDIQYSYDNNYIILNNLIDKDEKKEGFYYFDLRTKKITKKLDRPYFNRIIRANKN